MLNRRHLRVKILQSLYAYQLSENKDVRAHEKSLLQSVDKVYEMYIWMLSLIDEVVQYASIDADERANKYLPNASDLNPNLKILENKFIQSLKRNSDYVAAVKKYQSYWDFDPELIKSLFAALKNSPEYQAYYELEDDSIQASKDIIRFIFKKVILKSTLAEQAFEEKFINWPTDKDVLQAMIAKTFKNFSDDNFAKNKLAELSNNWSEDKDFTTELFLTTIKNEKSYQELISNKTQNWDAERIALMDILLMKMALAEFINFSSIPVKVTINEYLEISKEYSTPKSNLFINGILDKILFELKAENKIRKFGRGLLE